jgi:AP2-like factor (ANT lineage)
MRGSELSALVAEPKLEDFLGGISFSEQHHKANCNMIPSTSSTACYASSGATTGYHHQLYHQPTSSALHFADSVMVASSAGVHDGAAMLSTATANGGAGAASANGGGSIGLSMIKNWLRSQPAPMQPRAAAAEGVQGLSLSMTMAGTTQGATGMPLLAGQRGRGPESVSTSAQSGAVVTAPKEDSGGSGVAGAGALVAVSTDMGGSGGASADNTARKTVDTFGQRTSIYRGVTR